MPEGSLHLDQLRAAGPDKINSRRRAPSLMRRAEDLPELSTTMLAAECIRRLEAADIFVEQTSDFDRAMQTIEQLDKPYLTDYMSPLKNDFFESNCFWLVFNDGDGQPGGLVGTRFDDTGREPLSSYAIRKLRSVFPEEADVPVQHDRLPRIAEEISGNVVYMGDLYLSRAFRTSNRQTLRLIALLNYTLITLKWTNLDWIYAFMRDRDVRRGAAWLYHFPRSYPMAHSWTKPPSDQSGDNWLAAMSRLELMDLLTAYFTAPDRL